MTLAREQLVNDLRAARDGGLIDVSDPVRRELVRRALIARATIGPLPPQLAVLLEAVAGPHDVSIRVWL